MRPGSRKWVALGHGPGAQGSPGGDPHEGRVAAGRGPKGRRRGRGGRARGARRPSIRGGCGSSGSCCSSRPRRSASWPGAPTRRPPAFDGAPWLAGRARRARARARAAARLGPRAPRRAGRAPPRRLRALPRGRHPDRAGRARRGPSRPRLGVALRLRSRRAPAPDPGLGRRRRRAPRPCWPPATGPSASAARPRATPRAACGSGRPPIAATPTTRSASTLDVPEGWVALKPGNPLVAAPAEARLTLAQPRQGGCRLPRRRARAARRRDGRPVPRPARRAPPRGAARAQAGPAGERARRLPGRPPPRLDLARRTA